LYSAVDASDISTGFSLEQLSGSERLHIDNVLEIYAPFSGSDLEAQTHGEDPWVRARGTCKANERCTTELDEALMGAYYGSRLK
jgi:uncharacterized phage-associated protein